MDSRRKLFDVFLAHNSVDKSSVKFIARKLINRGLKPWLDEEQIQPGTFFQDAIQQAMNQVKSVAIFIGPSGFGKWQLMELRAFISVLVEKDIPVIPVLLRNCKTTPDLPAFLSGMTW
ncbi:MAG: toll/interleukin-1 receptor domain-containing protein [Scytonema sp. CRU_2_7]|nr:toll/interleukin-1 receptor domain-containing protein [Scytonema sp. CRU_2_7]